VVVPPYPVAKKITHVADVLHHHLDKRHIPDSAASQGKDNGLPPRHTGVIPGGYSGRVALRREQFNREQQLLVV
jgi:hypothetical protein